MNNSLPEKFVGKKIREVRRQKKITIKQLADAIGLSEQAVSQYELGKRTVNIEMLSKLASALDVGIFSLIDGDSEVQARTDFYNDNIVQASYSGVLSILEEIYGKFEERDVYNQSYGLSYLFFGKDKQGFYLHNDDVAALRDAIRAAVQPLVEHLKITERQRVEEELSFMNLMIRRDLKAGKPVDGFLQTKENLEKWLDDNPGDVE